MLRARRQHVKWGDEAEFGDWGIYDELVELRMCVERWNKSGRMIVGHSSPGCIELEPSVAFTTGSLE
jgi:hypothetical protein